MHAFSMNNILPRLGKISKAADIRFDTEASSS
jgi:hypothetical protein